MEIQHEYNDSYCILKKNIEDLSINFQYFHNYYGYIDVLEGSYEYSTEIEMAKAWQEFSDKVSFEKNIKILNNQINAQVDPEYQHLIIV